MQSKIIQNQHAVTDKAIINVNCSELYSYVCMFPVLGELLLYRFD